MGLTSCGTKPPQVDVGRSQAEGREDLATNRGSEEKLSPKLTLSNDSAPVLEGPLVGVNEFTDHKIYCNILAARVKETLNNQRFKFEGAVLMCIDQKGTVLGVELRPSKALDASSSRSILACLRPLKFPALIIDEFGIAHTYIFDFHGNSVKCELLQAPIQKTK